MNLRYLMCVALLLVGEAAQAQLKVVSESRATQVRTDALVIHSERIGRDFLIEVTLLDQPRPGRKYAAVYAVDAGLGVAGPISRLLVAGRRTAPHFVIAIGYANSLGRHLGPRNTDLVHERVEIEGRQVGGGGGAFEAFITQDLRPYLERRYPLDPGRAVLIGHSGGGLFAATVLVTHPDAFAGYVIGGLPLRTDSKLPQQAKAVAPRGGGRRVFIGLAPMDARNTQADQLAAPLSGPGSRLEVRQEVFPEETHNSVYVQLLMRGLPFVLPTETAGMIAIPLTPQILDRYVGAYRIDAKRVLAISRSGTQLFGRLNLGGLFPLEASTAQSFFSRENDLSLTFEATVEGKAQSVTARATDQEFTGERD